MLYIEFLRFNPLAKILIRCLQLRTYKRLLNADTLSIDFIVDALPVRDKHKTSMSEPPKILFYKSLIKILYLIL